MSESGRFSVTLAKEDFKFSAAHFTLFDDGSAELLHGHNYRVGVELTGRRLSRCGLLVDFVLVKTAVRRACRRFDGKTLIPAEAPEIDWQRAEGELILKFKSRSYRFPEDDVVLLPTVNSSIELLALLLWRELEEVARSSEVETLAVSVEETDGQRCRYEAAVSEGDRQPAG